ncbi:hypothetical protein CJ203_04270 [Corynebacterium tuscaniense]|uniref:Serine hydrolase n=1 Tax=Corynebacterium tuscaniense TaxID=302449 RepID=A0A2N6T6D1_9CORY|nr:hypothetical protein [Corynebacterium tuscaniense]PMC64871.1 hypothetical protein CJ203_04270 [Corynebacterium tuscaniense]
MRVKRFAAGVACLILGLSVLAPTPAVALDVLPGDPGERTDVAVYHDDGRWSGSPGAKDPRPALSLAKLYLGYWILQNGRTEDKGKVWRMVRASSDGLAVELDRRYPKAIDAVAKEFGLTATVSAGYWGRSATSPYDMAKFINLVKDDPVAEPIVRAMANHTLYAEDGFKQDFGTDRLQGVIGTKFGWSDDRSGAVASVSFGRDFAVAAMTYGDVDDHTEDVLEWIDQTDQQRRWFLPGGGDIGPALGDGTGLTAVMPLWLNARGQKRPVPTLRPLDATR